MPRAIPFLVSGAVWVSVLATSVSVEAQPATPTSDAAAQANGDDGNEELWQVATLVLGILSVVGTLGGTWLGHHLSEGAAARREAKAEAKQRESVRTLLRIEIDQNLAELSRLWTEVAGAPPAEFEPIGGSIFREEHAHRFIDREIPAWSRLMWESQAALLPAAMEPDEIGAVHRHYADLATLTEYHERLLEVRRSDENRLPQQQSDGRGGTINWPPEHHFRREAEESWLEIELLVNKLGHLGNPIKEEPSTIHSTGPAPQTAGPE